MDEVSEDELREDVRPLSERECRWVERLERTLLACPTKRLALVTIGDPALTVIDNTITEKHDLDIHDGRAESNGVALARILSRPNIHGVRG